MITIKNFKKSYGNFDVIKDITTTINKGDVITIIGPSGTGKSTFLRCLNMLESPTSGTVEFEDKNLKTGMVFQNFNLFTHLSVLDNLCIGQTKLLGIPRAKAENTAYELLKTVGLAERANSYPDKLSGGQKQRVAIARCLSMKPDIILFDEPTSALDPTMVGEVVAVMKRLAQERMTMVIVTHDMELSKNVSTRIFYMDEGGIYEDGPPSQIFYAPKYEKTRIFIKRIKSFRYDISSENFDFIALVNNLANFCSANALSKANINKAQLVAEELVMNLIPKNDIRYITFNFPSDQSEFEMTVCYGGNRRNIIQDEDNLSVNIICGIAKTTLYRCEEQNILVFKW